MLLLEYQNLPFFSTSADATSSAFARAKSAGKQRRCGVLHGAALRAM
jgi:hypothetical protein